MKYRSEIDGLRAIAVTAVILFHAGFPIFRGGFIGVDVFFVISGYLITSIIITELDAGTFTFSRFYEKRARRILPALFFVIICCIPAGWLWMMPAEFRAFSQSIIAAIFSVSNFYFWSKSGYFAAESTEIPLLHTWSLGVEEQFYIFFPIITIFLWNSRGRKAIFPWFLAIALLSIVTSYAIADIYPAANFYLIPTRAWELLFGAICSLCKFNTEDRKSDPLAAFGILLIALSVLYIDENFQFPVAGLCAVSGTGLVLVSTKKDGFVARFLSLSPLRLIGKISYSAYLWHQPIFAYSKIRSITPPSQLTMSSLILATFLLAYLTHRLIEEPFRHPRSNVFANAGRFFTCCVVLGACLLSFGVYANVGQGIPSRLPTPIYSFIHNNAWSRHCLAVGSSVPAELPEQNCVYNASHKIRYAIVGDSIAASLSLSLAQDLDKYDISLEQLTHSSCVPVMGSQARGKSAQGCPAYLQSAVAHLKSSNVSTVILAASWVGFFEESSLLLSGTRVDVVKPEGKRILQAAFQSIVTQLDDAGIRVVLVYPHPRGDAEVVAQVAKMMLAGVAQPRLVIEQEKFQAQANLSIEYLDNLRGKNIVRIYPSQLFCQNAEKQCVLAADGRAYLYDRLHFTKTGADIVASNIVQQLAK